jgi:hypothetical protein
MEKRNASITVFTIMALTLIVGYLCVWIKLSGNPFHCSVIQSTRQRRILLLHYTDPEELLEAGRDILRQGPQDLKNYHYLGPQHIDGFPVPRYVRIPRAIKRLSPRATLINYNGYVVLHMLQTRSRCFGVRIYPEGFQPKSRNFNYGHRELLPGLWYYDSNYNNIPEYDKTIDHIIQNGQWLEPDQTDPNENTK